MKCDACSVAMQPVSSSDFFDESGYIGFTAWQCPGCSRRIEEIETRPASGQVASRRIRYPVAA